MREGWTRRRLGEVLTQRREAGTDDLPVYSVSMKGLVSRDELGRQVLTSLTPAQHLLVKKGDLAYNMMRMWQGVAGVADQDCLVSPAYVVCCPSDELNSGFLRHLVKTPALVNQFEVYSQGLTSDRFRLYFRDFAPIRVELPSPSEQHRIAEILDTLDEAIRKTEQVIAKLQQMKQGLLQDLLTRGIDENGELRDPVRFPGQFKESELGLIPRGWEVRRLADCVRQDAPITYGIVQAGPDIPGGVPYIRTGDMAGKTLSVEGLLRTSQKIAGSFKRSEVRAGEIVCAIRATVGKVLPVPPELDGANLTQGTARIAPRSGVVNRFLLWSARGFLVQQQFTGLQKGTTFKEITLGQLRDIFIPMPTILEEQRWIAEALDQSEAKEESEEQLVTKLQTLKKGLMHDLLTGRVRTLSPHPPAPSPEAGEGESEERQGGEA